MSISSRLDMYMYAEDNFSCLPLLVRSKIHDLDVMSFV